MASAGGLMPHQKDENDIWICKDCRWKYPNARPSPKIRKNHKKHCPGKAGTEAHATGGSSDDVSDEDHHSPLRENGTSKETAVDAPDPHPESKSREFDLASLKENLKSEAAPAAGPVVNGVAKEAPAPKETTSPAVIPGALMPHQKDEHDIWICKECGWKYPNARPSPKIRKNHKKHCPGKGGPGAPGGSSDEASEDENHQAPVSPAVAVKSGREVNGSTATAPAAASTSICREIDLAALKESPSPELIEANSKGTSPDGGSGAEESSPSASERARLENAIPQQPPVELSPAMEPDKEDHAAACEVEVDFAAPKKSSNPLVKHKTPAANTGKSPPAVPGRKRTSPHTNEKPPWRY